jgi:hypothetical protein
LESFPGTGALVALESFPAAGALVDLALAGALVDAVGLVGTLVGNAVVGALVDAVGTDVGLTVGSSAR